jgi:nucleoside 2-deoxyribosyltransferase
MIYFAAPLFTNAERERNAYIAEKLREHNISVFLPQEQGLTFGTNSRRVFSEDVCAVKECDTLIATVCGASVDSGTAFEIGYAYALGKRIILYTDGDFRKYWNNNMLVCSAGAVCGTLDSLIWVACYARL